MSKKKNYIKIKLPKKHFLFGATFVVFFLVLFSFYYLYFSKRVYPGVSINNINISLLTKEEVLFKLKAAQLDKLNNIVLKVDGFDFFVSGETINLNYDLQQTANKALLAKRFDNNIKTFFLSPFNVENQKLALSISFDAAKLISVIAGQVEIDPIVPSVQKRGEYFVVEKGVVGKSIDKERLKQLIISSFATLTKNIEFASNESSYVISQKEADILTQRASTLFAKELILTNEKDEFRYQGNDLLFLLADKNYSQSALSEMSDKIAQAVNRPFQNPIFVFENGKVSEFSPSKNGFSVNKEKLVELITHGLGDLEKSEQAQVLIEISVDVTPPEYTTNDVNDLGIKELIGVGYSIYKGSIATRVHNVAHAAEKLNGVLIEPGAIFSFNDTLGDVSKLTGYQQAYVIKNGATVLGDGGGVCQVSTTLFRAALNAGLPIVERRAHSYRVGYYEQDSPPGLDATVYSPTTDFKFKNDTPGYLLIQSKVDSKNTTLNFEIYGTSDGRVATVGKPVITTTSLPAEDLYVDDPNLPAGTIKQIEWKSNGAQVFFDYTVTRNGEEIYSKRFYSNFRPWQAKFLRGTASAL